MGNVSRKKKKTMRGGQADESGILISPKTSVTRKNKKGFQKTTSDAWVSLIIIFILLSSFGVYVNSLFYGFVYDDVTQVLKNRWITDIRYIPEIFSRSVWSFLRGPIISNYYRPLMHLIYMMSYHIFGLKPWGFHLVNILFHAGVSLLVFIITSRLLRESRPLAPVSYLPSFIAAVLFATHPIHTEAVTWVAGLPDLSFTFFYLFSFYFYMRSTDSNSQFNGMYLLSVASFFLAALCKEPALTLPLFLVAYDHIFRKEKVQCISSLKKYIPYLIVAGVYFTLRFHALEGFAPEKKYVELSAYQYMINIFPLFMQYLEKLILPINLNAYYVFHPISSISEGNGILSFIITIAFVVLSFVAFRKNKVVSLGLLFLLIPLLPVFYIPVLGKNTFAERYLYIPSFGLVLLAASLMDWAKVNKPTAVAGLTTMFVGIAGFYSWGTVNRNTIWKDDYTFYADTIKKSPDGDTPRNNFGLILQNKGEIDEAIEQYQIALKLNPDYVDARNNLGVAFFKKGSADKAIEQYQIALNLYPEYADAHYNLGAAFFKKGSIDKAIEQYQIALNIYPDHTEAHNNLGVAFLNRGRIDEAIEQYQIALKLNPDYADAHNNLGAAFYKKGLVDKAIEQYQIALKLNPDYADAHNNLGAAFHLKGRVDEAIEQYQIALKLNPDSVDARKNLIRAYEIKNSDEETVHNKE